MTKIFKNIPSINEINQFNGNSMAGFLGIEITEIGDGFIKAKMPVNNKTMQPMGLLHGGASVVLSETIGSVASYFCLEDRTKEYVVGIEVNANHLRQAKEGFVTSVTKPVKIGRTLHVWNTDIFDSNDKLVCSSKLTVMVVKI